jgi:hypothetical protein
MRFLLLILLCAACCCYGQNYKHGQKGIISSKKIVLQYQQQTDSLTIPIVSDAYPALKEALSEKNLFDGDNLEDIIAEYKSCGCGTISMNYDIVFVNKQVISIKFYMEGMGAYPTSYQNWRTLNIATGKPYLIGNEINNAGLRWLITSYKQTLKIRIQSGRQAQKNDADEKDMYQLLIKATDTLTVNSFANNYLFTNKGITFITDRVLPHVAQGYEPDRTLFVPYAQLKPYLKPGSVVAKIVFGNTN